MKATQPFQPTQVPPVPVVFVHTGTSFYMDFTLRQARVRNAVSPIHLISDHRTNQFPSVTCTLIDELTGADYHAFAEGYVHSSPNRHWYELFCFRRWFLLRELMHRQGYERAFMADSDVMIYADLTEFVHSLKDRPWLAAFNVSSHCDWVHSASGHSSFWTRAGIDRFCQLLLDLFQKPDQQQRLDSIRQNELLTNDVVGISDMTALYLFYKDQAGEILNLSTSETGLVFDHNIGMAVNYDHDEYAVWRGQKKVLRIENGYPICFNRIRSQPVRMGTLHFQGNTKNLMHRYYTGSGVYRLRAYRAVREQVRQVYYRSQALRQQLPVFRPLAPLQDVFSVFSRL